MESRASNRARNATSQRSDSLQVERIGLKTGFFQDLYHFLLKTSWPMFFFLFVAAYLVVILLFAAAYFSVEGSIANARPGSFFDAFSFSMQTISTIGYGAMLPEGVFADLLATIEVFVGLLGVALGTGLVFAKFSRPTARIMFSGVAIVGRHQGQPALMVRMANERTNHIVDARSNFHLVRDIVTVEGEFMRTFNDLKLVREHSPIFAMTWTAIHLIDESSPLFGMDADGLREARAQLLVTFSGLDEDFSQQVHARRFYDAPEIIWKARFADLMSYTAEGLLVIDYARFHEVLPLEKPA